MRPGFDLAYGFRAHVGAIARTATADFGDTIPNRPLVKLTARFGMKLQKGRQDDRF
jgi:hypothetical protein